jgi:hypothetical protein
MSNAAIWDLSQSRPEKPVEPNTIGIAASLRPEDVIDLHLECGMEHIVQRDSISFESEVLLAQNMVSEPAEFFERPLDQIFGVQEAADHFVDFSISCGPDERKNIMLHQFESYLKGLPGTRSIREDALMIADELYTNGAKNGAPIIGPVDPGAIRPGVVQFVARSDGRRLVLGCIDSYGALEITMITKRIQACFAQGVARSINQNAMNGAGIGSYMVYTTAMSMYIGVHRGHKTIVLCALPLSKRIKNMAALSKNLHTLIKG